MSLSPAPSAGARPAAAAHPVTDRVREALAVSLRGCDELLPVDDWTTKLARSEATGVPLRVKLGLDPTAPDIHVGHTVVLNKMRQLQDLGHTVIFLIGDFTSMIGDPSGRNTTRPPLTREQIEANAQTYYKQASLVLDPDRTEIRYNSEWSDPLGARGMIQLAARYTVARIMEREDFKTRYQGGVSISVHELLYPLMQGYDSVAMKADVELGGTDQLFNLMVGRQLMKEYGLEPQCVITTPLLEGTDGHLEGGKLVGKKMSKSLGNYVGIQEPPLEMVGKLMSIGDDLMWRYLDLLSTRKTAEIKQLQVDVAAGAVHPMAVKGSLAAELTGRYHGATVGQQAVDEWMRIFSQREVPTDVPEVTVVAPNGAGIGIVQLLREAGLAESGGEARRLVSQGAVHIDGAAVASLELVVAIGGPLLLKVGKRRYARVTIGPPA